MNKERFDPWYLDEDGTIKRSRELLDEGSVKTAAGGFAPNIYIQALYPVDGDEVVAVSPSSGIGEYVGKVAVAEYDYGYANGERLFDDEPQVFYGDITVKTGDDSVKLSTLDYLFYDKDEWMASQHGSLKTAEEVFDPEKARVFDPEELVEEALQYFREVWDMEWVVDPDNYRMYHYYEDGKWKYGAGRADLIDWAIKWFELRPWDRPNSDLEALARERASRGVKEGSVKLADVPESVKSPNDVIAIAKPSYAKTGKFASGVSIGDRVRVSEGSGADEGKEGVVVSNDRIEADEQGVPTNTANNPYKPVDWSREVAVELDDGGLITMYKSRLVTLGATKIADEQEGIIEEPMIPEYEEDLVDVDELYLPREEEEEEETSDIINATLASFSEWGWEETVDGKGKEHMVADIMGMSDRYNSLIDPTEEQAMGMTDLIFAHENDAKNFKNELVNLWDVAPYMIQVVPVSLVSLVSGGDAEATGDLGKFRGEVKLSNGFTYAVVEREEEVPEEEAAEVEESLEEKSTDEEATDEEAPKESSTDPVFGDDYSQLATLLGNKLGFESRLIEELLETVDPRPIYAYTKLNELPLNMATEAVLEFVSTGKFREPQGPVEVEAIETNLYMGGSLPVFDEEDFYNG